VLYAGGGEMKITCVEQLDQMINLGSGMIDTSALSPAMSQALNMYTTATGAMRAGHFDEAAQRYREILALWPNFVAPRVNLADCLHAMGNYDKALRQLDVAHEFAPGDPDVHISAGRVYESLGNKERELEQYQEALRDSPGHIGAMVNAGITHREVGQLEESEQWLQRALKEIRQQESFLEHLGWRHPAKTNTLIALAETHEAANNWGRAVECWQEAQSAEPSRRALQERLELAREKARSSRLPWRR
jgi:tetratricopeptide (TPR) repeat protein